MIVKIVSLFLIFMVVLAMFGRLRVPKIMPKRNNKVKNAQKCPKCGSYILGKGPCACRRKT